MEITGLISGAASAITGLVGASNGGTYGIAIFLLLVVGILAFYKLFNILMRVVTVAVIAALAPFVLNLITNAAFGFYLFDMTANLIVSFMALGVGGYAIYKIVYWVLGFLEALFGAGHGYVKSHHKPSKKEKNDE